MSLCISLYFSLLAIFVVTCQFAWPTIFLLVPLAWLNIWYRVMILSLNYNIFTELKHKKQTKLTNSRLLVSQSYYLASSRELTRLDSITKAPVIHHFSGSISGVMTIRSFGKQTRFYEENIRRVNNNLRMDFHNNGSNEWLGFRSELLGSCILYASALFMILLPSSIIKPGQHSTPFLSLSTLITSILSHMIT